MIERWSDDGYWMYKDPNGEWVKYEDVKPELDRLEGDACDYSNWSNELYEENVRLKELNREVTKELTNLLFDVELSPPAQDRIDKIFDLLARGESKWT